MPPKRKQGLIEEEEDDAYSKQTKYKESNRKSRMCQRKDAAKLREEAATAATAAAKPPPPETGREQPSKASAKGSKDKGSKDNTTKDSNTTVNKNGKKQLASLAARKGDAKIEVDTNEAVVVMTKVQADCKKAIREILIKNKVAADVANKLETQ